MEPVQRLPPNPLSALLLQKGGFLLVCARLASELRFIMPNALGRRRESPVSTSDAPKAAAEEVKALREELETLRKANEDLRGEIATDMQHVGRDIRALADDVDTVKKERRAERLARLAENPTVDLNPVEVVEAAPLAGE